MLSASLMLKSLKKLDYLCNIPLKTLRSWFDFDLKRFELVVENPSSFSKVLHRHTKQSIMKPADREKRQQWNSSSQTHSKNNKCPVITT